MVPGPVQGRQRRPGCGYCGDAFFSGALTPTRSEKLRATHNKTVQVDGVALERGSPSVPR